MNTHPMSINVVEPTSFTRTHPIVHLQVTNEGTQVGPVTLAIIQKAYDDAKEPKSKLEFLEERLRAIERGGSN